MASKPCLLLEKNDAQKDSPTVIGRKAPGRNRLGQKACRNDRFQGFPPVFAVAKAGAFCRLHFPAFRALIQDGYAATGEGETAWHDRWKGGMSS
jgi:hypothetical protein